MLKKLCNKKRSRLPSWRAPVARRITERAVRINKWLRTKTDAIPPKHRKLYSIVLFAFLAIATLWNIYTIIFKK